MTSLFITPVFIFLTIVSYIRYKSFSHPVFVFNLLWSILSFLSLNNNLGYNRPSETVYGYLLLGGICFNIGSLLIRSKFTRSEEISIEGFENVHKYENTIFKVEILILLYYIYKSYFLISFLVSGNMYSAIRDYYFSESNFTSNLEILFVSYFTDPIVLLTAVLFAINIFRPIFSKKCSYVMLANVLLRAFISGGRTGIFELGIILVVCIAYFGVNNKKMKQRIVRATFVLLGLIVVGAIVSVHRHGDEGNLLEVAYNSVVSYFVGSLSFFDVLLANNDVLGPTYGLTTFGGISDIFIFLLRLFGLTTQPLNHISVGSMLAEFKEIGIGHYYNAMPTMYYFFYTDLREVGIIVFPLLFGYIACLCNKRLKVNFSTYNFVLYMLVMILVVESGFNWQFQRVHYFMAIVYSYKLLRA